MIEAGGPLGAGAAKSRTLAPREEMVSYSTYVVSRGHFRTLGIPLLAGRDFTADDRQGTLKVGIVNESLARQQWPGQSPIDKTLSGIEIVGFVQDSKYLQNIAQPLLYVPLTQNYVRDVTLVVKANGDVQSVVRQIRNAVAGFDGDIPIANVMTLDRLARMSLFPIRIVATLAAVLGAVAMPLAAMGIYGAVAFVVNQQTREIGIRMAIGATASRIVRYVTRQTVRWIITGLALGFGAAMLVSRAIARLIFGVSGADPLTFLVVAFILGSVAYAASWVPARRASRIDPIVALREE